MGREKRELHALLLRNSPSPPPASSIKVDPLRDYVTFDSSVYIPLIASHSLSSPLVIPRSTEMPKRKSAHAPDSLAANPRAAQLLASLVASGEIGQQDKASGWYKHPQYASEFSVIHPEKFRKRMKKLIDNKYSTPKSTGKFHLKQLF